MRRILMIRVLLTPSYLPAKRLIENKQERTEWVIY